MSPILRSLGRSGVGGGLTSTKLVHGGQFSEVDTIHRDLHNLNMWYTIPSSQFQRFLLTDTKSLTERE